MHDGNSHFFRQVFETVQHAFMSLAATNGYQQAINVALKEPGRRIGGVRLGQHDDNNCNISARHERLHAMQQRRLACHPAKLFELGRLRARAGSSGDDHHTDIAQVAVVVIALVTTR